MRCTSLFLLFCIVLAYAREQSVLDAANDDPNKQTPGDKYPAGKEWMEIKEFSDDAAAPPKPVPAEVPRPKKEEFVDPDYVDYVAPQEGQPGYGEGPVIEAEPGTPDVESYDGLKERAEAEKAEKEAEEKEWQEQQLTQQQQAQEEAAADTDPFVYPELRDVPEAATGVIRFDPSTLTGTDAHLLDLALKNTVVPEYDIKHPPITAKITKEQYLQDIENDRAQAILQDEAVDAKIQHSRDALYNTWAEGTLKNELVKQKAEEANSDAEKYLTPTIVDKHGHPIQDLREFYGAYPGDEADPPQAFPTAPDYVSKDSQQEYFRRLIEEQKAEEGAAGGQEQDVEAVDQEIKQQQQQQQAATVAEDGSEQVVDAPQTQAAAQQQQQVQQQKVEEKAQQQDQEKTQQKQEIQQQKYQEKAADGEGDDEVDPAAAQEGGDGDVDESAQTVDGQQAPVDGQQEPMTEESAQTDINELKTMVESINTRLTAVEDKEGISPPASQQEPVINQETPSQEVPPQQQAAQEPASDETTGEDPVTEETPAEADADVAEEPVDPAAETATEQQNQNLVDATAAAAQQNEDDATAAADEVAAENPQEATTEETVDSDAEPTPAETQQVDAAAAQQTQEVPPQEAAAVAEDPAVPPHIKEIADAEEVESALQTAKDYLEKQILTLKQTSRRRRV